MRVRILLLIAVALLALACGEATEEKKDLILSDVSGQYSGGMTLVYNECAYFIEVKPVFNIFFVVSQDDETIFLDRDRGSDLPPYPIAMGGVEGDDWHASASWIETVEDKEITRFQDYFGIKISNDVYSVDYYAANRYNGWTCEWAYNGDLIRQ